MLRFHILTVYTFRKNLINFVCFCSGCIMSSIVPNRSERSGSGASLSPRSDVSSPPSSPSFGAHRFTHQPHHDYQDSPPFSRILVVCDRTLSEKDVYDAFSKFGDIE